MKDATSELRKYYYTTLQGITLDGDVVPVYDDEVNDSVAPYTRDSPPDKYIILSNQNSADQSAKCSFQERHTIQVDSAVIYPAYNGGFRVAEQLNAIVKERMLTDTAGAFDLDGFRVFRSREDLSRNLSEKTKVQNIYKRITIFNHSIAEN